MLRREITEVRAFIRWVRGVRVLLQVASGDVCGVDVLRLQLSDRIAPAAALLLHKLADVVVDVTVDDDQVVGGELLELTPVVDLSPKDEAAIWREWFERSCDDRAIMEDAMADTDDPDPRQCSFFDLETPRPPIERPTCARCREPIGSGQHYATVRMPSGEHAPVHGACMDGAPPAT